MVTIGFLLACMLPFNAFLSLAALTAILGPVAVRIGGSLRTTLAFLAILDLLGFGLLCAVFGGFIWGEGGEMHWLWGLRAPVMIAGVLLGIWLLRGDSLPAWIENVLPVRKLHAHRLLTALALLAVLYPILFVSVLAGLAALERANRSQDVVIYLLILFAGTVLYLLPLWDVLVRGWSPPTAAAIASLRGPVPARKGRPPNC